MKRMKKLISIGSVTALTLVLLIVLVSVLEAAKPTKVDGSGSWTTTMPTNWVGSVTLTIGEDTFENVEYTVTVIGSFGPNKDGVYKGTVDQILDFGNGTIATIDTVILEPEGPPGSGLYTLTQKSTSIRGGGIWADITGAKLHVEGNITNFPPPQGTTATANFQVSGSISYGP